MLLERIFLVLTGLSFLVYGVWCLLRPETLADVAGLGLANDVARVEVTAMYGGLQIAVGLLALAGLQSGFRRTAIGALSFIFVGLALGRGYGMFTHEQPGSYNQIAIAFEMVSAAISAYLLLRFDDANFDTW